MNDNFDDINDICEDTDLKDIETPVAPPAATPPKEPTPIVDCTSDAPKPMPVNNFDQRDNQEATKNALLSELKDIQQDFTFSKIDAFLMKYQVNDRR